MTPRMWTLGLVVGAALAATVPVLPAQAAQAAQAPPGGAAIQPDYRGTLRVVKTDAKNGHRLAGAVFELWVEYNGRPGLQTRGTDRDIEALPPCATDERGTCEWSGLTENEYYLREVDTPEGYVLPKKPVTGPIALGVGGNPPRVVTKYLSSKRGEPDKGGKGGGRDDRDEDRGDGRDDEDGMDGED
ncbi:prealbumin-like fold domain-containing protein [Streptomyces sp. NPDC089919]|uniref:prealbumin-like fold domain-containing protein n=1 Tax=Streptomyces sp. NPDC089919 TaxID=3155188 RepID=UPI00342FAACF